MWRFQLILNWNAAHKLLLARLSIGYYSDLAKKKNYYYRINLEQS